MAKVVMGAIRRLVLGNHSDCDCTQCGYPMGCGDVAYEYGDEIFCSRSCAQQYGERAN